MTIGKGTVNLSNQEPMTFGKGMVNLSHTKNNDFWQGYGQSFPIQETTTFGKRMVNFPTPRSARTGLKPGWKEAL